jgi:hypothetical protein
MILTVDRKKKFLITMLIIMGCATMINYGLYNVLNSYFKNSNTESVYSTAQMNIIIVLTVIASVTVIMIVLIPKENVNEIMTKMSNGGGTGGTGGGAQTLDVSSGNLHKLDGEHPNTNEEMTDEEQLQSMIDEDLTEEQDKDKK